MAAFFWDMDSSPNSSNKNGSSDGRERRAYKKQQTCHSLPRAHFFWPNDELGTFSRYTTDFWLKNEVENFTDVKKASLAQLGYYSPKIPRSSRCEDAQFIQRSFSSSNIKQDYTDVLPLKMAVFNPSPLCAKPQEVKTFVVKKPTLMRAVISSSSSSDMNNLQQEKHHSIPESQGLSSQEPELNQDMSTRHHTSTTSVHPSSPGSFSRLKFERANYRSFSQNVDCDVPSSPSDQASQSYVDHTWPDRSPKHQKNQRREDRQEAIDQNHEISSRNVFGQPRVKASLRAACSPRPVRRSSLLEDLKKLIVMDDAENDALEESVCEFSRHTETGTYRSFSNSSSSLKLSSPFLQSFPESPALYTHPSTPETECLGVSGCGQWEDPACVPRPGAACDDDWNCLLQAAQAYESQWMANLLSQRSPNPSRPDSPSHSAYNLHSPTAEDEDDVFVDFPDQLSHLEGMLRRLSSDLLKEKRDKVALLAEVLKLRISNQHLREESLCATARLHKISSILSTTSGTFQ